MDIITEILGSSAASLQLALILFGKTHQAYLIWKNRSSENISLPFYLIATACSVLYLFYGICKDDFYVYGPQIAATPLGSLIIGQIIHDRRRPKIVAIA